MSNFFFDNTPPELLDRRRGEAVPLFVACGMGVNSVAGLILLHRLGDIPDAVLFADTGAEKHATYAYKEILNDWLSRHGMPPIITVRRTVDHDRQKNEEKYNTLEEECLVKKTYLQSHTTSVLARSSGNMIHRISGPIHTSRPSSDGRTGCVA